MEAGPGFLAGCSMFRRNGRHLSRQGGGLPSVWGGLNLLRRRGAVSLATPAVHRARLGRLVHRNLSLTNRQYRRNTDLKTLNRRLFSDYYGRQ